MIGSTVSDILRTPRANDSLFEIHTPRMLQDRLNRLKTSMDIMNSTAKGDSGWDSFYSEFQNYYNTDKYGWLSSGDADWNELGRREQELENWKQQFRQSGVKVSEPTREKLAGDFLDTAIPNVNKGLEKIVDIALIGVAIYAGVKVIGYIKPKNKYGKIDMTPGKTEDAHY